MQYSISVHMITDRDPGNALERAVCLLEIISKTGAIYPAAKQLNMTYSRAWNTIREVEETIGEALLIRNGGSAGSKLTHRAEQLITEYRNVKSAAQAAADALVQETKVDCVH